MNLLIIDQCSGSKRCPEWFDPLEEADIDGYTLDELRNRERTPIYPARELYTGKQQRYIDSAVGRLRDAGDTVDRYFISAGFGLVDEQTDLPPYDVTFQEYDEADIRARSDRLAIESDLLEVFDGSGAYDVVFLALGSDYYEALDLDQMLKAIPESTIVVLFNSEEAAAERQNVVSIPARLEEAKAQETTVIGLKGHYLKQFASNRVTGSQLETPEDILQVCTSSPTEQSGLDQYERSERS